MKKNLIYIVLFLGLFFVVDSAIGWLASEQVRKLRTGFLGTVNNTVNDTSEILILGSSRAQNHYDSQVISQNLGCSTFNGGQGGYGTLYTYAVLKERLKRRCPKIVVLDIAPNILVDEKQFDKLTTFNPLTSVYPSFFEIVRRNPNHKEINLKMNSIQFNSTLFDLFYDRVSLIKRDAFTPIVEPLNLKTFVPFYFEPHLLSKDVKEKLYSNLNLQLEYAVKMQSLCNQYKIPFYVVISPSYVDHDRTNMVKEKLFVFLAKKNIKIIDFTESPTFKNNPTWFHDQLHLNAKGAAVFSNQVSDSLIVLNPFIILKRK